jgi:hypothetical protein
VPGLLFFESLKALLNEKQGGLHEMPGV